MAVERTKKVRTRQRGKKWSYSFEGARINGKRKPIEKGGFATEQEAYEAGLEAYKEYRAAGSVFSGSDMSVSDFMDMWLEKVAKVSVKPNTLYNYKKMIRCHINPCLGGYALKDITPVAVDNWITQRYVDKGLSYSTLDNMLKVLKVALDYAVYPGQLIRDNPARMIKVPRAAKREVNTREPVSVEQMQQVLDYFRDYKPARHYWLPILIGYHTGFRIGEVLALEWSNIDFELGTITCCQQIQRLQNAGAAGFGGRNTGAWYVGPPKTKMSERIIRMDKDLIAELKRAKAAQAAFELRYGGEYMETYWQEEYDERIGQTVKRMRSYQKNDRGKTGIKMNLVCTQECGDFIRFGSINAAIGRMRRELDIPHFDFHTMRHTHAQMLIEGGAKLKDVSARLGHASIDITLDTYTAVTKEMQDDTIKIFESIPKAK